MKAYICSAIFHLIRLYKAKKITVPLIHLFIDILFFLMMEIEVSRVYIFSDFCELPLKCIFVQIPMAIFIFNVVFEMIYISLVPLINYVVKE